MHSTKNQDYDWWRFLIQVMKHVLEAATKTERTNIVSTDLSYSSFNL